MSPPECRLRVKWPEADRRWELCVESRSFYFSCIVDSTVIAAAFLVVPLDLPRRIGGRPLVGVDAHRPRLETGHRYVGFINSIKFIPVY
jgi:hypothetical protein